MGDRTEGRAGGLDAAEAAEEAAEGAGVAKEGAIPRVLIRDFAYPESHELHKGPPLPYLLRLQSGDLEDEPEAPAQNSGPPYPEDDDLHSPIRTETYYDGSSSGGGGAGGNHGSATALYAAEGTSGKYAGAAQDPAGYMFQATSPEEVYGPAVALYDFAAVHDNEVSLKQGQVVWISYRHGEGWLVAQDPDTGESGLVPEEYCELMSMDHTQPSHSAGDDEGWEDDPEGGVEAADGADYVAAESMSPVKLDLQRA